MKPDISRATAQVEAARAALDRALENGGDSVRARDDLQATEARLAALTAPAPAPVQDADEEQDLQGDAWAMAEPVRLAIADRLDALLTIERPAILDVTPSALLLARTRRAATQAADLIADRQSRVDALRARLASLDADRQGIIARRLDGDTGPDDAPTMALLDADLEGLRDLVARIEADPVPAMPSVDAVERQWAVVVQRTEQVALSALVIRLQAALLATVDALGIYAPFELRPTVDRRIMAIHQKGGKW